MYNIKKKNKVLDKIIKHSNLTTKVQIFLSSKSAGDDFDEFEKNYLYSNLNPIIIKALVRDLTGEQIFYKQYGLHASGVKEIICEDRWREALEKCNKLIIGDDEYAVFREGTRTAIVLRPNKLIRVTVSRKE